jgi:predicted GH43/DUF377 family glycosyl hydrolase
MLVRAGRPRPPHGFAALVAAVVAAASLLAGCGSSATSPSDPTVPESRLPSARASAEAMAPTTQFAFASDQPAVSRQMTGIDEAYINPGAVIEADGVLHMFANVFTAWPGLVQVPHLTSADGRAWMLEPATPVLTSDEVPFGAPGADVSTGFLADDGTWVLVFETVSTSKAWILGRATATAPEGPWTIDPEPILEPGPGGSFDAGGLHWPSVVRTADGYAMYYAGFDAPNGTGVIAMATSGDGISWTRRDEPVLSAELDWEQGSLDRPRVARTADGYAMIYSGADLTDRGLAFSSDGMTWTRDGELPVITQDDFPVDGRSWDAALVYRDGALDYYLEIGTATASRGTQVYLASANLP